MFLAVVFFAWRVANVVFVATTLVAVHQRAAFCCVRCRLSDCFYLIVIRIINVVYYDVFECFSICMQMPHKAKLLIRRIKTALKVGLSTNGAGITYTAVGK